MPTDPVFLAFSLCVPIAFLVGILLARDVLRRRYAAESRQLEAEMTSKLQERYKAYIGLEAQVRRIFVRLDELETETAFSLEATGVHIVQLDQALAACEGTPAAAVQEVESTQGQVEADPEAAPSDVGEALGWMNDLDEVLEVYCGDEDPAAPDREPATTPQAAAPQAPTPQAPTPQAPAPWAATLADEQPIEIDHWQQKLEALREEKRAEIERQGQRIAELTERMQRLQTSQAPSAPIPLHDERDSVLAKEVGLWRDKYETLHRNRTHEGAELLALREEAASLTQQVAELEPLLAVQAELSERVQLLESDLAERTRQLEGTRVEVQEASQLAADWARRHDDLEQERRAEIEALQLRIHDLEPLLARVAELRAQVEAFEEREEVQTERTNELEADGKRLRGEVESLRAERKAATEMLSASKRALEEADERQRGLEQRIESLGERNESLMRELAEARRNIEGQINRIGNLTTQLEQVRHLGEELRQEADMKGSMVEAAEGLLAELKPKLQALEDRLQERRSA